MARKFEWHGQRVLRRMRKAEARATVRMADEAVSEMKQAAHVETGRLRSSIGAFKPDTIGEVPAGAKTVTVGRGKHKVEVGSYLAYACVENNRGGAHRFADIGWAQAKPKFRGILAQEYVRERLR